MLKFVLAALLSNPVVKKLKQNTIGDNLLHMCSIQGIMHLLVSIPDYSPLVKPTHLVNSASIDDDDEDEEEDNIIDKHFSTPRRCYCSTTTSIYRSPLTVPTLVPKILQIGHIISRLI